MRPYHPVDGSADLNKVPTPEKTARRSKEVESIIKEAMMPFSRVKILRKGDLSPYPELVTKTLHHCELDRVTLLEGGMESGRSSVAIIVDLPDGSAAFIQTSARNFELIAAAVRGGCKSWGEDNT